MEVLIFYGGHDDAVTPHQDTGLGLNNNSG